MNGMIYGWEKMIEISKRKLIEIRIDRYFIENAIRNEIKRNNDVVISDECPIHFSAEGKEYVKLHGAFISFYKSANESD